MKNYFKGFRAWRRAFLDLVEYEQPEEIRSRGVDTQYGPYYEQKANEDKARVELVRREGISQN